MMDIVSSSKLPVRPDTLAETPAKARSFLTRAFVVGTIIGVVLSLLLADFGRRVAFDTWQNVSPREISAENVVVVMIDDEGMDELGAWPWSRYVMARLIEEIGRGNPRAIGIDIYFTQPDPLRPSAFASLYLEDELDPATRENLLALPVMDEMFAQVLGQTPSVLARVAIDDGVTDPQDLFFDPQVGGTPPPDMLKADRVVASIFGLDGAAMGHGMVNGAPDDDGTVRRVPLAVGLGEIQAPGFALELARIASGADTMRWDGANLMMGDRVIPADRNAAMKFRMGTIPPAADISAWRILTGDVSPEVFADKVVIVGVGATGTYDVVATPLQSEIYGAFVQAQAVDAILEKQWLSRPPFMIALEIVAALVLLGFAVVVGIGLRRWLLWPALAFAALLPLFSWLAFTQANLLFDPVRPLLIGACAAIALTITRYALARTERARLASELVEERVMASAQKGELEAARRIQMSMVPSQNTLSRLDHRAEVGAVLEPAKSVGGDFFDAVKIDKDLLLFMVGDVTGKGVPAALFMALSKTLSKSNLARAADGLAEAVAALNHDLMNEADDEMGLTMLVGTINCANGSVELINAGHENPMIVHGNGTVETFEMVGGPPFCVIEFPYSVETIDLAKGDTLVIITDGATEAANEADQMFGLSGVLSALTADSDGTAFSRASHLAKEVRLFEGTNDPTDDLTIFALRYLGATA